eukprot:8576125-Pyramimonas_sp.AAC.1
MLIRRLAYLVAAVVVLAHEEVEAEDAKDEVEEEAHQHHVGNAGDGLEQRVHHHLRSSHDGPIRHRKR